MSKSATQAMPCLLETWHLSESLLFHWLIKQCHDEDMAFDLLQETFLRALLQENAFCDIDNRRAWLFRVAVNLLNDQWRMKAKVNFDDQVFTYISVESEQLTPIDSLAQCLPKVLLRINSADKLIIEACDLNGMSQQEFAQKNGLTLSATKSRIQRARNKLKQTLKTQCQIRFDEQQRVCCFIPSDP
jgi:RNA polymerase sigma-70 factor (ECF subfamily)